MSQSMKAIVCPKYGGPEVLQIIDVEKPIPKDNEVLVKVHASSVTLFDCWQRSCTSPPGFGFLYRLTCGFKKPKQPILGTELAGEIEAVGRNIKRFKKGDQVFAFNGMKLGAYVEYICIPEDGVIAEIPSNMNYKEAAAVQQGALTANYFLRATNIQSGQRILIFGASGGVGTFAVQLAKYYGAEVTGVASSEKLNLVKSLGADKVIDYTKEDFTKSGEKYDIIFDTVGKSSVNKSKESLKEGGYYLFTTFGLPKLFQILWHKRKGNFKVFMGTLQETTADLIHLKDLIETGVLRVVIDRSYPMSLVSDAHRYVENGKKKGQVVITFNQK